MEYKVIVGPDQEVFFVGSRQECYEQKREAEMAGLCFIEIVPADF